MLKIMNAVSVLLRDCHHICCTWCFAWPTLPCWLVTGIIVSCAHIIHRLRHVDKTSRLIIESESSCIAALNQTYWILQNRGTSVAFGSRKWYSVISIIVAINFRWSCTCVCMCEVMKYAMMLGTGQALSETLAQGMQSELMPLTSDSKVKSLLQAFATSSATPRSSKFCFNLSLLAFTIRAGIEFADI